MQKYNKLSELATDREGLEYIAAKVLRQASRVEEDNTLEVCRQLRFRL